MSTITEKYDFSDLGELTVMSAEVLMKQRVPSKIPACLLISLSVAASDRRCVQRVWNKQEKPFFFAHRPTHLSADPRSLLDTYVGLTVHYYHGLLSTAIVASCSSSLGGNK